MSHGLILDEVKAQDYVFGGQKLGDAPLVSDGQWTPWLPPDEVQNLATEPQACVSFGTLNCVEMLIRFEHGRADNYSDRFLAKASGTTSGGNTPQKVAEKLKQLGCALEKDWPYTPDMNTWEKFYANLPQSLYTLALAFKAEFSFGHEYVPTDQFSMMKALEFSPLGVAVDAWHLIDGLYRRTGPSNHWCVIYGYKRNEYWLCFDSYDNTRKKLAWDFSFEQAKRYTLHRQIVNETAWTRFLAWLRQSWLGRKLGL